PSVPHGGGRGIRGHRQIDIERRPLAQVALNLDMPAMPFHDLPYQVEADPGAGDILELRVVNPVKLLEQVPAGSLWNANPVVPDHQMDSAVLSVSERLDVCLYGADVA